MVASSTELFAKIKPILIICLFFKTNQQLYIFTLQSKWWPFEFAQGPH